MSEEPNLVEIDAPLPPPLVAIKALKSHRLTPRIKENLSLEISLLTTLKHPNITSLYFTHRTQSHIYLALEYCGGGDLQRLIRGRKSGRLGERLCRRLMRDLASGLKFLWGKELIHRDIKPQNLLLTSPLPLDEVEDPPKKEGREMDSKFDGVPFMLKIADFGFARHLETAALAETLCGSPLYMAPEILQHQKYGASADLWSTGAVLFEMIAGRPPFSGLNHIDLLKNIQKKAVRLPENVKVSAECVKLLRMLLNRNPVGRGNFEEFYTATDNFVGLGCGGTPCPVSSTNIFMEKVERERDMERKESTGGTTPNSSVAGSDPAKSTSTPSKQSVGTSLSRVNEDKYITTPPMKAIDALALAEAQFHTQEIDRKGISGDAANNNAAVSNTTMTPIDPSLLFETPNSEHQQYSNSQIFHQPPNSSDNQLLLLHRQQQQLQSMQQQAMMHNNNNRFALLEPSPPGSKPHSVTSSPNLFPRTISRENFQLPPPFSLDGSNAQLQQQHNNNNNNLQQVQQYSISSQQRSSAQEDDFVMVNAGTLSSTHTSNSNNASPQFSGHPPPSQGYGSASSSSSSSTSGSEGVQKLSRMLSSAEDIGSRAITIAHVGDLHAFSAVRLMISSSIPETAIKAADAPPSPPLPPSTASSHKVHLQESLSLYMYSLRLLRFAVDSVTSVTSVVATASTHPQHASLLHRCEISRDWLVQQFNGVLERADAANGELSLDIKNDEAAGGEAKAGEPHNPRPDAKRAGGEEKDRQKEQLLHQQAQQQQNPPLVSPQELIYNAALRFGKEGARHQILQQYPTARKAYKRARLLVESLETMERDRLTDYDKLVLADLSKGFRMRIEEIQDGAAANQGGGANMSMNTTTHLGELN